MRKPSNFTRTMKRAMWPAIGLTIIAFFGGYAVLGRNGVLAHGDYKRQLVKREKDYAELDRRRAVLKNRVALLNPDRANPDMVDEMVRKELNVAHPDEVIVPLVAELPLRPASGPVARWLEERVWRLRALFGLTPADDMFR